MKYAVTIVILIACCVTVYAQSSITKIDFVKIDVYKRQRYPLSMECEV